MDIIKSFLISATPYFSKCFFIRNGLYRVMLNLIDQINAEIEKQSLLKHDFYRLWQEGKLTLDHLAGYSREYFQLVKIVPTLVENALKTNKAKKYENSIQTILQD